MADRRPNTVCASFLIVGEEGHPLPEVTAILGVEPSKFVRAGDAYGGPDLKARRDIWEIDFQAAFEPSDVLAEVLDRCLERLLDCLERNSVAAKLVKSGLEDYAEISLTGWCKEVRDANMHFKGRTLARLATLGIALDEDFYLGGAESA